MTPDERHLAESVRTDPKLRCLREELEDHTPAQIAAMIVALNKRHVVERALRQFDGDVSARDGNAGG